MIVVVLTQREAARHLAAMAPDLSTRRGPRTPRPRPRGCSTRASWPAPATAAAPRAHLRLPRHACPLQVTWAQPPRGGEKLASWTPRRWREPAPHRPLQRRPRNCPERRSRIHGEPHGPAGGAAALGRGQAAPPATAAGPVPRSGGRAARILRPVRHPRCRPGRGTSVRAGSGAASPRRSAHAGGHCPRRPVQQGDLFSVSPILTGLFTGFGAHLHFPDAGEVEPPPPGLSAATSRHLRPGSLPPPPPRGVRPHAPQAPWPRRALEAREPGALYPPHLLHQTPRESATKEVPRAVRVRGRLQGGPELLDLAARGDLAGGSWGRGSHRADGPCSPSLWGTVHCSSLVEGPPAGTLDQAHLHASSWPLCRPPVQTLSARPAGVRPAGSVQEAAGSQCVVSKSPQPQSKPGGGQPCEVVTWWPRCFAGSR